MAWQQEFIQYATAPFDAWPAHLPLQGQKLMDRLSALAEARDASREDVLAGIVQLVGQRSTDRPPTLFLVNCGSSGSHWIEAMLAELPQVHACGEVYVSPPVQKRLITADPDDRAGFLDALHLLHVQDPAACVEPGDILVNSAHSWGPHDLMGSTARTAFLLRDPADVALSRTFRKPKLRRHLRPTSSDVEYLEHNISFVDKFYRAAMRRNPEVWIRYEDTLMHPATVLGKIAALLDMYVLEATLQRIGERYAADKQRDSSERLSNLYRGPESPDQYRAQALRQLHALRSKLGYAHERQAAIKPSHREQGRGAGTNGSKGDRK